MSNMLDSFLYFVHRFLLGDVGPGLQAYKETMWSMWAHAAAGDQAQLSVPWVIAVYVYANGCDQIFRCFWGACKASHRGMFQGIPLEWLASGHRPMLWILKCWSASMQKMPPSYPWDTTELLIDLFHRFTLGSRSFANDISINVPTFNDWNLLNDGQHDLVISVQGLNLFKIPSHIVWQPIPQTSFATSSRSLIDDAEGKALGLAFSAGWSSLHVFGVEDSGATWWTSSCEVVSLTLTNFQYRMHSQWSFWVSNCSLLLVSHNPGVAMDGPVERLQHVQAPKDPFFHRMKLVDINHMESHNTKWMESPLRF